MPLDAKACLLIVGLAAHAACGAKPRAAAPSAAHVDASAAAAGARFEPRRSVAEAFEERGGRPAATGPPTVPEPSVNTRRQPSWVGARGGEDGRVGGVDGRRRLGSSGEERRVPVVDHVARPDPIISKIFASTMIFEEGERRNEEWRRETVGRSPVDRWKGDSRRQVEVMERHNLRHKQRLYDTSRGSLWGE